MVRRNFDFMAWQVTMASDQPYSLMIWHSSAIPHAGNGFKGQNYSGWRHPGSDRLIDVAMEALDPEERRRALAAHQRLFSEELPALPLYSHTLVYLADERLEGFRPGRLVILAARSSGGSLLWLARAHLLPNIASAMAVAVSLDLRNRIMVEATLSFLGFGVPAPYPSWGTMIASVQAVLLTHPWALLTPLLALFIFSYSVQQIGLGLSSSLDPQRRRY
jgi:hypothetical protein